MSAETLSDLGVPPAAPDGGTAGPRRLALFRGGGMGLYLLRRIPQSVIVLLIVIIAVFFIFYGLGDPTDHILGPSATDAQREAFRHARGFDQPLLVQFGHFARNVATLQFGTSYSLNQPAMPVVLTTLPRTLILAAGAFVIAVVGGVLLGMAAAFHEGGVIDRSVVIFGTFISSIAEFWTGLLLIVVVSVHWGLLPSSGYGIGAPLILPAITLALAPMGRLAFVTRTNALVAMKAPYVSPARARGLRSRSVMVRHVLRNAAAPSVAIAGMELTRMIVGGSVVVESVFAWPGIGRLFLTAMKSYDLPVIMASMFVGAVFVLVLNLVLDIGYVLLDPRVRFEK